MKLAHVKSEPGVAGAKPMRGESEGCPLGNPPFFLSTAEQRESDAQPDTGTHGGALL
jgi:hypothetical protein